MRTTSTQHTADDTTTREHAAPPPRTPATLRRRQRHAPDRALAVAVVRVSKDEEIQELGAEAQRAAILAWSVREQITIAAWVTEEVSGGAELDDRPRLLEAVAHVEAHGAAHLVFHRLDRFARNTTTAALIQAALARVGASISAADGVGNGDDPASRLVRGILLEVAAFERALIQARITAALAVKRGRGELVGNAPFGFRAVEGPAKRGRNGLLRSVRLLVPEPGEQATISEARRLRAEGRSVRQVIAALAAQGRRSRAGRAFTLSAMHAMLTRRAPPSARERPLDERIEQLFVLHDVAPHAPPPLLTGRDYLSCMKSSPWPWSPPFPISTSNNFLSCTM